MKAIIAAAFGLLPIGAPVFSLRPVCRPLSDEDLKSFTTPIEQRTDKDFWVKMFQKRGDRWLHCKTWISRQFFFRGAKEKGAGTARAFSLSGADAYCFGAAGAGAQAQGCWTSTCLPSLMPLKAVSRRSQTQLGG